MRRQYAALWSDNVVAWDFYRRLCDRSVRALELGGSLLLRDTADWPGAAVWDLLDRLTIILDIVAPEERHGENTSAPNHPRR